MRTSGKILDATFRLPAPLQLAGNDHDWLYEMESWPGCESVSYDGMLFHDHDRSSPTYGRTIPYVFVSGTLRFIKCVRELGRELGWQEERD